ncbi:MAG: pyruvate formate lyase family protein [Thermodesulfobacteriota bacterium]|nr:pyruvate formate lyase family protein [Thermodesulfobacteriota bacterium]
MSTATLELKKEVAVKGFRSIQRGYDPTEIESPYAPGVKICIDRARLLTQSYKDTEGLPIVLRRAMALANILEYVKIYIGDKEQIVGNTASTPDSLIPYPEYYWRWLDKQIEKRYKDMLDDADREELHQIYEYWQNISVQGKERDLVPDDVKPYWKFSGPIFWGYYYESGVPNFEKLFQLGLKGLIEEAEDKLTSLGSQVDRAYFEKTNFLRAVIISLKAGIHFAKRFSVLANEMAERETNSLKKIELEDISEICDRVPENPPRNFHEALQFLWFITLISRVYELNMNGYAVRLDQLLYPIYRKDKEGGLITRGEAQELLEYLWLKFNARGELVAPLMGSGNVGFHPNVTFTIGGVTSDGRDATNEMSYIILDASKVIKGTQPQIAFRYHDNIPKNLLMSAIDLTKTGVGYPPFFNDKVTIPMIVNEGIPIEDARNYGIESCMRWTIPGKNITYRAISGVLVGPKCLELALNQGIDKFSGKQTGVDTADPETFTSVEDIMDAYLQQVRFFMDKLARIANMADLLYEKYLPRPFLSALLDGCIERGEDCRKWSYFDKKIMAPIGLINVADGLAAIKKLVFDEKRVRMSELVSALKNNWEGKEDLRQIFLNAPKFGNDDDYVDEIVKEVQSKTAAEMKNVKNSKGNFYQVDGSAGANYFGYSTLTGATPDGRKDKDLFADGTLSPERSFDKKGPTAVLKSTSKIDPLTTYTLLFNQKFPPQYLEGENKELFAAYLKTWADLGHFHIQFNVMDRETLLDAQKNPGEYADLVVRLAGYSVYFVDLPKMMQDEIINRTEQRFT